MVECFTVYANEIEERIDPFYYRSFFAEQICHLSKTKFDLIKVKDLCVKITDGTHYTPKYLNEGIPFISVKDVRENEISFEDTKFISREENKLLTKRCKPEPDDILLTKVGTVGLSAVIPKDVPEFSIFVSVALLKIDKTKANPYYVSTYLNSKYTKIQIDRVLKGIGVPDLHLENIAEIKIPLPPLSTQNHITQIMDNAYKLKKHKQTEAKELIDSINDYVLDKLGIKLTELKEMMCYPVYSQELNNTRHDAYYFQPKFAILKEALQKGRYKNKKIREIVRELLSGQRPVGGVRQITEGIPSLGGEHVLSDGSIATSDFKYIPIEFHKTHLKSKVQKKDILIVKDGATTGKVGIVPENYPFDDVNINEHVFLIRCKENINQYYLFTILKSDIGQIQINIGITGGTIMGIIREALKNIEIPLPPIEIQNKIADEVKSQMQKAEQLQKEAKEIINKAKEEVEKIILN
ncbi:restriction endonuclease subunit S [candidate division WOR-3 bacterium]|nr:restriction endonuclease subunit S [candidate division WOR-3 bacterium]